MKKLLFLFLFSTPFLVGCSSINTSHTPNNTNSYIEDSHTTQTQSGYNVSNEQVFWNEILIPTADAESFKKIGNGYAADNFSVFWNGKEVLIYNGEKIMEQYKIDIKNLNPLPQENSASDGFFFLYKGDVIVRKFCLMNKDECYYSMNNRLTPEKTKKIVEIKTETRAYGIWNIFYDVNKASVLQGYYMHLIPTKSNDWEDIKILDTDYLSINSFGIYLYNRKYGGTNFSGFRESMVKIFMGKIDVNSFKVSTKKSSECEGYGNTHCVAKDATTIWQDGKMIKKLNSQ